MNVKLCKPNGIGKGAMRVQVEKKILCNLSLTPRQVNTLSVSAKGLQITMQELLRRMIDEWIDDTDKEGSVAPSLRQ